MQDKLPVEPLTKKHLIKLGGKLEGEWKVGYERKKRQMDNDNNNKSHCKERITS